MHLNSMAVCKEYSYESTGLKDFKLQVQELAEELEAANERWEREKSSLKTTQRMHDKEERGMSREIQELTAITDQLRSSVLQSCRIMRSA